MLYDLQLGGIYLEIKIFWNHVGREHGGLSYTATIKKNPEWLKKQALKVKLERCLNDYTNRFIRHDENTLIEIPPLDSNENFIIIYCIKQGLQFSFNFKKKYNWWLVDIVDIEEIQPNIFCVHDLFLDISLESDGTYTVLDMDEYHFAYQIDVLSSAQHKKSMASYATIIEQLNTQTFDYNWLDSLRAKYINMNERIVYKTEKI